MFYALIVGSRSFDNYELLKEKCDFLLQNKTDIIVVSGGAKGTDSLAERYAKEKGYPIRVFPVLPEHWEKYGKRAGFLRNQAMHQYISEADNRGCIVFWDGISKGAQQSFKLAEKYNNPIRVVKV